jgi:GAF domain-containing protein
MIDFYNDNNELIDLWTSKFLSEFERPRTCTSCRKESKRKLQVAFGRTTYIDVETDRTPARRRTVMTASPAVGRSRTRVSSIYTPTKLSESRAHLTQQRQRQSLFLDSQDSKMQGVQMLNFNIDRQKAEEKSKRMKQYARELRLGARSQLSREIDSITRLVVKSFKTVILAERCALFLHDASTNELYFKPVGDNESHARLKEIRFPAKQGVAGWCATNKQCLNIHNAYKDHRFNSDIDKKTGFRTRTILCHPVLSNDNTLLGVIQMVNKRKGDARELRDKAKKKMTSDSHKGYNSCFEPFSERDEEILAKCCYEVSKSLQAIFAQFEKKTERNLQLQSLANQEVVVEVETGDCIISQADLSSSSRLGDVQEDGSCEIETTQTETQTEDDSTNYRPDPPPRRSSTNSRRRSSVGTLAQFIKRNSLDASIGDQNQVSAFDSKGISEAIMKLKFRSPPDDDMLRMRETERRQSDSEYLQALSKRNRMNDYHKLKSNRI